MRLTTIGDNNGPIHGVDGVMAFFDLLFDAFDYSHQWPERFIECGDRVLVFVRFEARARTTGLEISEA